MKRNILILLIVFSFIILSVIDYPAITLAASPNPAVIISPSSFSVSRGRAASASINYQFTGSRSVDTILNLNLNSPGGNFAVGSDIIEVNAVPLTVNIRNDASGGMISEVISVPVRVIERAIQKGSNRFIYLRTFTGTNTGTGISINTSVNFNITTEAAADFDIKRIELYFENRRAETTVGRNCSDLKAYADIRFTGSGLLRGYWEVDGRVLSYFNRHLPSGRAITLQTPEIPPLPTFDTGTHIVRFVITDPIIETPLPAILYFVTPAEVGAKPVGIRLIAPGDETMIEDSPVRFAWEKPNKTALFLLQFFDDLTSKPVFSAYTKDGFYSLPKLVREGIFSAEQKYYWQVKSFDAENNISGESAVWSFSFKRP